MLILLGDLNPNPHLLRAVLISLVLVPKFKLEPLDSTGRGPLEAYLAFSFLGGLHTSNLAATHNLIVLVEGLDLQEFWPGVVVQVADL